MNTKNRPNIRYGNVEISDDELAPSAARRRISIMIPEDVLARLRAMASRDGLGYQTLVNQLLRDATNEDNSVAARLERIEKAISRR